MTAIVERAIVVVVKLEAPTRRDADLAFAELRQRLAFTLPRRRFGTCTVISSDVQEPCGYSTKFGPR